MTLSGLTSLAVEVKLSTDFMGIFLPNSKILTKLRSLSRGGLTGLAMWEILKLFKIELSKFYYIGDFIIFEWGVNSVETELLNDLLSLSFV